MCVCLSLYIYIHTFMHETVQYQHTPMRIGPKNFDIAVTKSKILYCKLPSSLNNKVYFFLGILIMCSKWAWLFGVVHCTATKTNWIVHVVIAQVNNHHEIFYTLINTYIHFAQCYWYIRSLPPTESVFSWVWVNFVYFRMTFVLNKVVCNIKWHMPKQ